jgi:hypothetical protein
MAIKRIIVLFVETPRKFITAKDSSSDNLSVRTCIYKRKQADESSLPKRHLILLLLLLLLFKDIYTR